jgi:HAD superfamily hydrolase (TIGR01509 family)
MSAPRRLDGIEAISFDLFETLVDGELGRLPLVEWNGRRVPSTAGVLHDHLVTRHPVELASFMRALGEIDRELRRPRWEAGRELPNQERFDAVVERLGIEDDAMARELGELHVGMIRSHTTMPSHHPELLRRLRKRFRIALCSNFTHSPTALRILDERGLRESFDTLVISDEVDIRKPHRGIFDAVAQRSGVAAARILHVGDRLGADVAGAAAVGMRTAWITRSVPDPDGALADFTGPAPDLELADLAELEHRLG